MARKPQIVYKKSGQRLKQLLDEYDMTQTQLSELDDVALSRTTINQIIKGKKNLSEASANEIVRAFPNENSDMLKDWLMGRIDFRNTKEQFVNAINQSQRESSLLMTGLNCFAQLSGFSIDYTTQRDENNNFENSYHHYTDGFTITRNDDSRQLSLIEMNRLQNEVCDYIEFILDRIVTGKRSV